MTHLIDKDRVVTEIKRRMDENRGKQTLPQYFGMIEEDLNILSIIDTLEVKEVDLEHEVESYWKQCDMTWCRDAYSMTHIRSMLSDIAKHFFELGLKASCSVGLTPDLDTLFEEEGIDPYSKEAKSFKEAICKATEKYFVKTQKGE